MKTLAKPDAPVLVWDYSTIENDAPAEIIQAAASQIKTVFRRTLENIIEIGKLLHVVREHLPHGSWRSWLEVEIGMSTSSAANYLNAYGHADEFRAVENWSAGAAFLLVGSNVPENAIESANQLAESGQKVTKDAAQAIIDDERDPAETDTPEHQPIGEVDHDVDRTRQAPETAGSADDLAASLKLARTAWLSLARLADINEGGALAVAREAWHELKASGELTLGDNGRPCDSTIKSFLMGAVDE